jgi:anti-sigma B factor antagonist
MSIYSQSHTARLDEEESLTCDVVPERDAVRVCPLGALDLATGPVLEQQLAELRAAGFRHMIVDLRGLTFLDSTGLQLVLRWQAAARVDGFAIDFVPGPPEVQRVFELTGVLDSISFVRASSRPAGSRV